MARTTVEDHRGQTLVLSFMLVVFAAVLVIGTWATWHGVGRGVGVLWATLVAPVVAILLWALVAVRRSSPLPDAATPHPVHPLVVAPPDGRLWTLPEVAGRLAAVFEGTPVTVAATDRRIVITQPLPDTTVTHQGAAGERTESSTVTLEQTRPGRVRRTDATRSVEWRAGGSSAGARATTSVGRQKVFRHRSEPEITEDGLSTTADHTVSTDDVDTPLTSVLTSAGWTVDPSPASVLGLLMAAYVPFGAVITVVAAALGVFD